MTNSSKSEKAVCETIPVIFQDKVSWNGNLISEANPERVKDKLLHTALRLKSNKVQQW